jgi:hypothetical protein
MMNTYRIGIAQILVAVLVFFSATLALTLAQDKPPERKLTLPDATSDIARELVNIYGEECDPDERPLCSEFFEQLEQLDKLYQWSIRSYDRPPMGDTLDTRILRIADDLKKLAAKVPDEGKREALEKRVAALRKLAAV